MRSWKLLLIFLLFSDVSLAKQCSVDFSSQELCTANTPPCDGWDCTLPNQPCSDLTTPETCTPDECEWTTHYCSDHNSDPTGCEEDINCDFQLAESCSSYDSTTCAARPYYCSWIPESTSCDGLDYTNCGYHPGECTWNTNTCLSKASWECNSPCWWHNTACSCSGKGEGDCISTSGCSPQYEQVGCGGIDEYTCRNNPPAGCSWVDPTDCSPKGCGWDCQTTGGCSETTTSCSGVDEGTCRYNPPSGCSWSDGTSCSGIDQWTCQNSPPSGCSWGCTSCSGVDQYTCENYPPSGCSWSGWSCDGEYNCGCNGTYGAGCGGSYCTGCQGSYGGGCTGTYQGAYTGCSGEYGDCSYCDGDDSHCSGFYDTSHCSGDYYTCNGQYNSCDGTYCGEYGCTGTYGSKLQQVQII